MFGYSDRPLAEPDIMSVVFNTRWSEQSPVTSKYPSKATQMSDSKNMGYDTYYIYVKLQPTAMLLAGLYPELKQTMVETISPVLS